MKKLRKYGEAFLVFCLCASVALNIHLLAGRNDIQVDRIDSTEHESRSEMVPELESTKEESLSGLTTKVEMTQWISTIGAPIPVPNYPERDLQHRVSEELQAVFEQIPDRMLAYDDYWYSVLYSSDTIFSTCLTFYYKGDEFYPDRQIYNYICLTYDLRSGKILGLDDILDVEALFEIVHTEGFLYYPIEAGSIGGPLQEDLDRLSAHGFMAEALLKCRDPQIKTYMQPTFYITEEHIWFYDIMPSRGFPVHIECFVKLDDVRHILKIEI